MAEIQTLAELADEQSTYVITATFKDENSDLVVPVTATWTLADLEGTIINAKQDIALSPLTSAIDILLSGADLAISAHDLLTDDRRKGRILTVKSTYNSSLGNDLPLKEEVKFYIRNLTSVS